MPKPRLYDPSPLRVRVPPDFRARVAALLPGEYGDLGDLLRRWVVERLEIEEGAKAAVAREASE